MDYSSMVESLDKILKEAAANPDRRPGQAGLPMPEAGGHRCIRSHSSATSPIVDGVPLLIHAINARSNLNASPHSLSRN